MPIIEKNLDYFFKLPNLNEYLTWYKDINRIPEVLFKKMMDNFRNFKIKWLEKKLKKTSK